MKKSSIIAIVIAALIVGAIGFLALIAIIAVPNVSDVQKRSEVSTDIATANDIGHSVKIWSMTNSLPNTTIEYSKLNGLKEYISLDYEPRALEDGEFYIVNDNGMLRIAIARDAEDVNNLTSNVVDYDGKNAGWAYIEGSY